MKRFITFSALLLLAACSTGAYKPRIDVHNANDLTIHLDDLKSTSSEEMSRLLLREAAHAAIDHGGLYLRIDQLTIGDSTTTFAKETPRNAYAREPGTSEVIDDVTQLLLLAGTMSMNRSRSGSIAITIGREPLAGQRVFEASRLLDQLHRGEVP